MATRDLKIPTSVLDSKLPKWEEPPHAEPHPDPKKRRTTVGQDYGTVDKHGNYHGPTTGMLPERVSKEKPWPERSRLREEPAERALKRRNAEHTDYRQNARQQNEGVI